MNRKVLILCTGNSCRSQMAQGYFSALSESHWTVCSAGTEPAGFIHPLATAVMQEDDVDISENHSKPLELYQGIHWDLVITVCQKAAESCPGHYKADTVLHWRFADPAEELGDARQVASRFRCVRDEIKEKIIQLLAGAEAG